MKGTGTAPFLGFAWGNLIAPSTLNFRIRSVTATYSFPLQTRRAENPRPDRGMNHKDSVTSFNALLGIPLS